LRQASQRKSALSTPNFLLPLRKKRRRVYSVFFFRSHNSLPQSLRSSQRTIRSLRRLWLSILYFPRHGCRHGIFFRVGRSVHIIPVGCHRILIHCKSPHSAVFWHNEFKVAFFTSSMVIQE
jgi:hypothetical protein